MSQKKYNVVIVGGGFAGVKAAIELSDRSQFNVTLISTHHEMRIYGSLYHTVAGGSKKVSMIPLTEIFEHRNITVIFDTVTAIDRDQHLIITEQGKSYPYTALVLALGVQTCYFNIEGLAEYSFGIKSLEEADELKNHLHSQLVNEKLANLHYVVVGGGPTGVELAGVLPSYLKQIAQYHGLSNRKIHVDLVEAAPRLLPRSPKDVSRSVKRNLTKLGVRIYLNTAVQAQTADELLIHGKPIRSHTVIWTAGMTNNDFFKNNNFQLTRGGKVRVDQFLQAELGIYVLGDNADTPYSGMAQTALYDGMYIANHLERIVNNEELKPYRAKKPIYVMPAGPKWAAVVWGKFRIYGRLGWALRRAADFVAYRDYESWPMAFSRFLAENDRQESCPICAQKIS